MYPCFWSGLYCDFCTFALAIEKTKDAQLFLSRRTSEKLHGFSFSLEEPVKSGMASASL